MGNARKAMGPAGQGSGAGTPSLVPALHPQPPPPASTQPPPSASTLTQTQTHVCGTESNIG